MAGSEAAEIAAHSTRESKLNLNRQDLLALNRKLAAEYGNNPPEVVGKAIKRATGVYPDQTKAAWEAVTWSRDRNFEREAVADERMVLRDALNRAQGQATLGALEGVLEQRIRSDELVKLAEGPSRLLTTAQMVAMERSNINRMARGFSLEKPLVTPEVYQSLVRELGGLSAAQRQAEAEAQRQAQQEAQQRQQAAAQRQAEIEAQRQAQLEAQQRQQDAAQRQHRPQVDRRLRSTDRHGGTPPAPDRQS